MTRKSLSIRPGTVALLALGSLSRGGRMYGFQILNWIEDRSDGALLVEEGALYPALHRMQNQGWLTASWAVSEKGRRAKYYSITPVGQQALANETKDWGQYVNAVEKVVLGGAAI